MSIPTPITRQQLQAINRRSRKYTLDTAEKDYYITLALALMVASPLQDILVFKGGTALHHCYLDRYRFSEDIDFSSREPGKLTLAIVKAALEQEGLFQVRKEYVSGATIKIERLWYPGILDQPGAIKVEIDQLQNVVLPPQERVYHNDWDIPLRLAVMDIREICAEKIRAASQLDEDMALASFTHGCASNAQIPADSSAVLTHCASMMAALGCVSLPARSRSASRKVISRRNQVPLRRKWRKW